LSKDAFKPEVSSSLIQAKTSNNVYISLMSKLKHGFNTKWEVHLFV